ncbi:nucleotidyltransferase domain-containing protein [Methylobacter sp. BlB1]|uniref:nucleotidyltransferase domain-containing protein n=1 Tax=Methylobacter sp. BlB1 TaxID=2785914 RepID=UPI0018946229|nr:nucleotidyltransferase domain-containing protein [Methylobacter sp. BlB1]MBF6649393.1 nucleotidyltransferase domain-containing protein [Methylobacter sp. BlB1]
MKYGLKKQTIAQINAVFAGHPEIEQVILYGSRAKGNYKDSSDIDLALKGHKLNSSVIDRVNFELEDLFLPYCFDISLFSRINNAHLIDHINHIGVIFYESANVPHLDRQNSSHD